MAHLMAISGLRSAINAKAAARRARQRFAALIRKERFFSSECDRFGRRASDALQPGLRRVCVYYFRAVSRDYARVIRCFRELSFTRRSCFVCSDEVNCPSLFLPLSGRESRQPKLRYPLMFLLRLLLTLSARRMFTSLNRSISRCPSSRSGTCLAISHCVTRKLDE